LEVGEDVVLMVKPSSHARLKDPIGYPDFTLPVSILAQVIESLKVDIVAQTLGNLKIEIAAVASGITIDTNVLNFPSVYPLPADQVSSLQQVTIQNIAAGLVFNVCVTDITATINIANFPSVYPLPTDQVSSLQQVTIQNIAAGLVFDVNIAQITASINIANWPATYPLPSDQVSSLQQVTIQNVAAGLYIPINIAKVTADLNIANFPSEYPLPADQVSSLQNVTIQNVAAGLYIPVNIAKATATVDTNAVISGVVAGVYVPITIHSVEAGVVFDVNISNVAEGVVVNVNVTGTPTVNIQTSSGANIVIDKLTQDAYTERQSTLANNGDTPAMAAYNLTNKRGKFFPRGCRGFIRHIRIYCDNTDTVAHTFTIKVSPMPGMGPLITKTLSVAAGSSAAWRSVTVNMFWNYDSMFIWVASDSDSYGRLGYDTGAPYDYYVSTDEVTWTFGSYRYWFQVSLSGETVGDIPVSGTVNTIEVPSVSSVIDSGAKRVNGNTTVSLISISGSGVIEGLMHKVWVAAGAPGSHNDWMQFVVDGTVYELNLAYLADFVNYRTDTFSPFSITVYDDTNKVWGVALNKPIKFQRSFEFRVRNNALSGNDFHAKCVVLAHVLR